MPQSPPPASRARNTGSIHGWVLFTLVAGVVALLVVIFVRNLPDPPRYDALTIDPGSEMPVRRPFGIRLEIGEGASAITRSWRASELEVVGRPLLPEVLDRGLETGDSWRLVAGLNVELSETMIVGLLIEIRDVEYVIRSGSSEIASGRVEASELRRIDDFLVPAGSRVLEFDLVPIGPDPIFRGSWIDEADRQRPLAELAGGVETAP